MPSLGADMEAGTLLEWRIEPGDRVERGDIVALIDTDKAEIEIEIWQDGIVDRLDVSPGQTVPVGATLATLREEGESAAAAAAPAPVRPPASEPRRTAALAEAVAPRVRASPFARRRARDLGVALAAVKGTRADGAVTSADVEAAAGMTGEPRGGTEQPTPRAPGLTADRLAAMRRGIATAMARSKREIPHYYLETEIDLSRVLAWLEAENRRRSVSERLLHSILLLKAVARALATVPELNGYWLDGGFRPADGIHVGVGIAVRGGGLLAPAIVHVDRKDLDELMRDLRDLVGRARRAMLRSSEMTEATITVTSLGERGVEKVFGIIYPPQVALVGFGTITEKPWAEGGRIEARPVISATLSGDHRASDGHRGARFLAVIARLLQEPEVL